MSAIDAMELSEREDRVVHLRYSDVLAADLHQDCDGSTEDLARGLREYWGERWRVHLHHDESVDA